MAILWRCVERWLRRRLPPASALSVIGDLREDFAARRARSTASASARWLIVEARSLAIAYGYDAHSRGGGLSADQLAADWRVTMRGLRRRSGFAAAAIATLTIGFGAAAASWAIFDALLRRPLDYPRAEQLLLVSVHLPGEDEPGASISFQEARDLADRVPALDAIAGYWDTNNLQSMTPGGPVGVRANFVQGDYFAMLGAAPQQGRLLDGSDDRAAGQHPVAVVSEQFWRTRLEANSNVVGSALRLNNRPFTIVGVVRSGFRDVPFEGGGEPSAGIATDVWVPAMMIEAGFSQAAATGRGVRLGYAVGRVRDGHTVNDVRAQLGAAGAQLEQAFPDTNRRITFWADPLDEWMFRRIRQPLRVVFAGSLALLLVGALNVGGLLLVRQRERAQELIVRRALGASRLRLLTAVAMESACIAGLSAVLAVPAAVALLAAVRRSAPLAFPRLQQASFDAPTAAMLVVLALAAAAAIAAMSWPAVWRIKDAKPSASRSMTSDRRTIALQRGVAAAEIALAAMLLVCGALVVGSLLKLDAKDIGFSAERMLTMKLSLRSDRYREDAAVAQFVQRVSEETRSIPGVDAAVLWGPGRPGRSTWIMYPVLEVDAGKPDPDRVMVWRHNVSAGALAAVGIPVVRGREFTVADINTRPFVVVVSESMAKKFWPGRDPIGQRFTSTAPAATRPWFQVIGVAADAAQRGRLATLDTANYDFYQLLDQRVERSLSLVVRSAAGGSADVDAMRRAIARVDPELAVQDITPMSSHLAAESASLRFASLLLASYAVIAFVLSAFGLYALMSYVLVLQRRDLALRQALGATVRELFARQLSGGAALAAAGVAAGLLAAFFASTLISSVLFGVDPRSPIVYASTAAIVLTAALLAAAIPARRIRHINPASVLQSE